MEAVEHHYSFHSCVFQCHVLIRINSEVQIKLDAVLDFIIWKAFGLLILEWKVIFNGFFLETTPLRRKSSSHFCLPVASREFEDSCQNKSRAKMKDEGYMWDSGRPRQTGGISTHAHVWIFEKT